MKNMLRTFGWRLAAGLLLPGTALALVNPNFTPVHLVQQSETILELSFDGADEDGMVRAVVRSTLKGEASGPTLLIDPEAAIAPAQQEAFVQATRMEGQRALLFVGAFEPGGFEGGELDLGIGAGGEGPKAVGFLHIDGLPAAQWLIVENWEDDLWDMVKSEAFLLATFNGGTDMLQRMIAYILSDPEADVPVEAGIRWIDPPTRIGQVPGPVGVAAAVRTADDAPGADLFLAGAEGDRLFRWEGDGMTDITARAELASRSRQFAWGDFNGSGRLDLASFDGERLSLHLQQADGTFTAQPLDLGDALADGCLSLAAVGLGGPAAGLIVGTRQMPVAITFANGAPTARPLLEDPAEITFPDGPAASLAADFDGDGLPDVLQLGAGWSLLYRGTAPGRFAAPDRIEVATGSGGHGVALGDFDQNGLPDLFVASEHRHLLWQNRGESRFEETMMLGGEVSYKLTSSGSEAHAVDFSNDGRVDLLIAYAARQAPYILYNRGFRSFAHALNLDLDRDQRLPQTAEGQQAVCFGDFNGNGAVELAIVIEDGSVWIFRREVDGPPPLAVRAELPPGEAGPVSVRGMRFERALGMRLAEPGAPAVFGAREPGPIRLTWQFPGGEPRETEIILEDGPVRFVLTR